MATPLQIATFESDATPPIGAALCLSYVRPAERVTDPLTCRGVILLTEPQPTVLCAVDWLGISNEGYTQWRAALAQAAGTQPSNVFLHCVHQHNATAYDPTGAALLAAHGLNDIMHDQAHVETALRGTTAAIREAMQKTQPITHLTAGAAAVKKVASNRRILGPDGKVGPARFSSCKNAQLRAEPEGLIDPLLRVVGLWHDDKPIARLSWYATHPQSYYDDGAVTWDFPGVARQLCEQAMPGTAHVHFTGAAGDIAPGKYNDGSPQNRPILAQRLADGLQDAWRVSLEQRIAIDAQTFTLRTESVLLPLAETHNWPALETTLRDQAAAAIDRAKAAQALAWRECSKQPIELSALYGAGVSIVNLPGEPSIAYQLALQALRPNDLVCVAGYGDYGPSYICTESQYAEGGYEVNTSLTAPSVERVLTDAFKRLMA